MTRKIIGVVLALLLAFALVPTAIASTSNGNSKATEHEIRQAAAWQVLTSANIDDHSEWKGKRIAIEKPVPVHDPAGTLIAYLVNVDADGQPAGYVMVSAFLDEDPILQWTEHGRAFSPETVKGHLGSDKDRVQGYEIVWGGAARFVARFRMKDGTVQHVDDQGVFGPRTVGEAMPTPQGRNDENRRMWGVIKKIGLGAPGQSNPSDGVTDVDPRTWEPNYTSTDSYYLFGMDLYNQKQFDIDGNTNGSQWSGCSPTAGSNIMAYWAANGYPNLNKYGQEFITLELRSMMQTTQTAADPITGNSDGSTPWLSIGSGLTHYVTAYGYSSDFTGTTLPGPGFDTVVSHLRQGHPGLLSFYSQGYFHDHTVAVVGSLKFIRTFPNPYSMYYVVRNNWTSDTSWNLYVKYGTWTYYQFDSVYPK